MVTAGRNSLSTGVTMRTYCDGSSPPSVTSATSRTKTGLPFGDADHHVAHVLGGAQELAGFEQELAVAGVELARRQAAVGQPERAGHLQGREIVGRQLALGSSTMRISRRCPPISVTAETSGTCLMASCTCAAMRRSSKSP